MISKRLYTITSDLDASGMKKVNIFQSSNFYVENNNRFYQGKERVATIHEEFERKLISEFAEANKDSDFNKIREYSLILFDFNGGESCIAQYIAKYVSIILYL